MHFADKSFLNKVPKSTWRPFFICLVQMFTLTPDYNFVIKAQNHCDLPAITKKFSLSNYDKISHSICFDARL